MERVVGDGGYIVFDLATEACVNETVFDKWLAHGFGGLPISMVAEQYVINFFCSRGLSFVGTFFVPMEPIKSQYFIFEKNRQGPSRASTGEAVC